MAAALATSAAVLATPQARASSARTVLVPAAEHEATIAAMRPTKRSHPVVAVIGDNEGAETTDFLVPYAILTRSGVADVVAVAPQLGPILLGPALAVRAQQSLQGFDTRHPDGADYVIIPALFEPDPKIVAWIKAQATKGAIIVGVCSGVQILSASGLLKDRAATGYWGDIDRLRADNPTMRWIRNRRYVVDKGVVTTTGVTASVPVSLAIVEAIAGRAKADALAAALGADGWHAGHDTDAFRVEGLEAWATARTRLIPVASTSFGIPVADGVDDVALAFMADSYSRVYRNRTAAVAAAPIVRTRGGLELIVDQGPNAMEVGRLLGAPLAERPARALDAALADIADSYGTETAEKIAHQLEYPRGSFGRRAAAN